MAKVKSTRMLASQIKVINKSLANGQSQINKMLASQIKVINKSLANGQSQINKMLASQIKVINKSLAMFKANQIRSSSSSMQLCKMQQILECTTQR